MYTRNYYKMLSYNFAPDGSGTYCTFVDIDGATRPCYMINSNFAAFPRNSYLVLSTSLAHKHSEYYNEILFGDGDVQPTPDDYFLSGNVISTISLITKTYSLSVLDGDDTVKYTFTFTIKNTGTEEVTIREVGRFYPISYMGYSNYGSSYRKYALMDRALLDEPVTIPPDTVAQVVYEFAYRSPYV